MPIFDKLKENIFNFIEPNAGFNPEVLNDEIAMKTDWEPVGAGNVKFRHTRILKKISPRRIEFNTRIASLSLPTLFMVIGGATILAIIYVGRRQNIHLQYGGIPLGSALFLYGLYLFRCWTIPSIFDLNLGYYWKSRNKIAPIDMRDIRDRCRLKDIHAIQLLEEFCRSSSRDGNLYHNFELNLILKDGRRLNIMVHKNQSLIRSDAQTLARFINVPVWDATWQGE